MSKRISHIIGLLGLSVLVGHSLSAPKGKVAEQFELFDTNHDAKLSAEEIKPAPWAALINGADVDNDGFVTIDEARDRLGRDAAQRLRAGVSSESELLQRFTAGDKNKDGQLSKAELGNLDWLMQLDRDEDGQISLPEMRLAIAKVGQPFEGAPAATPPPPFEAAPSLRQAPRQLKPSENHIGSKITIDPKWKTSADATAKATVIALMSPSCPIGKRFLPELVRLSEAYSKQNVAFHYLRVNDTDDIKSLGLKGAIHDQVNDPILAALGAKSTTDVFVLDAAGTLVYRGAISDQYGLGYSKDAPTQEFLKNALDAVISGRSIEISATAAPGCALDLSDVKAVASDSPLTYHNRISRIIQQNCQECHRAGGVAPFGLETYQQVTAKSGMIRKVVTDRIMPPWFAAKEPGAKHNIWKNDRSLTDQDRQDLLTWLENGKAEGDVKDAPLPRVWPDTWMIGKPDVVYQIPKPIAVKAEGFMSYQNVRMETMLTEDKWVQAWEVQPTAREVVHHVLIFVLPPAGKDKPKRQGGAGSEAYLAAFVPGSSYVNYPAGYAKFLPAGSRLHFQIHYTPNGKATEDQVRVGLVFAKAKPANVVEVVGVANSKLRIPAGADNHPEPATIPVPESVKLIGFMPHMHVRGKAFRYELTLPNGDQRSLLEIPRYDFNWQLAYRYEDPPIIPAGSKIRAIGWFDNSSNNPANPDPTKVVTWGEQTTEEMMIGYVEYCRMGG